MKGRGLIALGFLILSVYAAYGQQEALYSQYIFNLYALNPAYAGARDALSVNGSYRAQWVGFEGAPSTQNFNIHAPLRNENMAVGLYFQNDQIGARRASHMAFAYAYSLRLDKDARRKINFGLQAGAISYQYDWDALDYQNPGDPVAFSTDGNFWLPSFDFGVMYIAPKAYLGLSATGLQNSRLYSSVSDDARLSTFLNLQAGYIHSLSDQIDIKPFGLVRHELGGPVQVDLGLSTLLMNHLWLGAIYRHDFGMVFSAQVVTSQSLVIGYAYDWAINGLRAAQSATHEVYLGIDLSLFKADKVGVRYF